MQGREKTGAPIGGLAGWVAEKWKARMSGGERKGPRLRLVERIALAPRQSLALVEAEGQRFLVATSTEGGPAFYALDAAGPVRRSRRVSW